MTKDCIIEKVIDTPFISYLCCDYQSHAVSHFIYNLNIKQFITNLLTGKRNDEEVASEENRKHFQVTAKKKKKAREYTSC